MSKQPADIKLHTRSRELELIYPQGESYRLSCEYLRVFSPSAEVKGHGPGQEVLQFGKKHVGIRILQLVVVVIHYFKQLIQIILN